MSPKTKAYAGVLPYTIDRKGKKWVLLGREAAGVDAGKWSDFGGGVETKDTSYLEAAFREMNEESMGVLETFEPRKTNLFPSVTFDFGSFHGTLVLVHVGALGEDASRVDKKEWEKLEKIPVHFDEARKKHCGSERHDPKCEKDCVRWFCIQDIKEVGESIMFLKKGTVHERTFPLRKSYGLLLSKALQFLEYF